ARTDLCGGRSAMVVPTATASFPSTDFHTATLAGEFIYVIGCLGYHGTRQYGTTPVYRLHTGTFEMQRVEVSGPAPGWIYEHRAFLDGQEIWISEAMLARFDGREVNVGDLRAFVLDIKRFSWREL
ncbi:MAG: hypothetical protein ABI811_16450, partial [Acidobacteriota bacterium]